MRSLLSTACVFLLAESVLGIDDLGLEFRFGDIVRFDRAEHFGLALGEKNDDGELFFHKTERTCEIKALNPSTKTQRRRDNYQDDGRTLTQNEINDIRRRFLECKTYNDNQLQTPCCGKFDYADNNCEHTVTYIRYGLSGRVSCLAWFKAGNANNILYTHYPDGKKRPPRSSVRPPQCQNWQEP